MDFRYSNYGLVVSIDFGNSLSGACYAITDYKSPKELRKTEYPDLIQVTDWPMKNNSEHKAPTIIINDRDNYFLHAGMSALNFLKSGRVKDDHHVVERFKFDLPTSIAQRGAFHLSGSTSESQLLNMRAMIDYLREFFDHAVSTMQIHNRSSGKDVKIERENMRFVITVPGQWNGVQRGLMRIIAIEAGLILESDHENRLLFINESLAGSLYCERIPDLKSLRKNVSKDGFMLNNDKYIVCDAGGTTVNITVLVSIVSGNGILSRYQLTTDIGYNCGSVFLDFKMKEILLNICFGADKEFWDNNKSKRLELESLIRPLTDLFLINKTNFGTVKKGFRPDCCREALLERYGVDEIHDTDDSENEDESILKCKVCHFFKGNDAQFVQLDNFGDDTVFSITQGKILNRLKLRKDSDGVLITDEGVTIQNDNDSYCEISLSYKYMRENVFDEVVNNTIKLIRRQIKKAGGYVARTYLIGGFGGSPYLRKRIINEFPTNNPYSIGNLIQDDRGDTAAMLGALIYGIDNSGKDLQSDVIVEEYGDEITSQFNTLVCLDIGYNTTACSYRNLTNSDKKMTDIINWPGLNEERSIIPTAKKHSDIKTLWGAQIKQVTNCQPELFVTPSKLMSTVKGIFKVYLISFLRLVFEHVHSEISKANPELSDKNKYRYVITMENCYPFFKNKSEMTRIAQIAGILNDVYFEKRLLLIRRENAAAIYFENVENRSGSYQFLQIRMYHDTCHLSLHDCSKVNSNNTPEGNEFNDFSKWSSNSFRNVRSKASATFEFNFISKLVKNLGLFISNSVCCKDQKSHDTTTLAYFLQLRTNFQEYMKNKLDFLSSEPQIIKVTKTPGCQISITKYEVLEHVFWPVIRELTLAIKSNGFRRNVFRSFNIEKIDRIFLSGFLIEAKKETYDFLEKIVIKNLTKVMNVKKGIVSSSVDNGKEALLGAAYYGNYPQHFIERISRKSYAVQVRGYKIRDFELDIQRNISEIQRKGGKTMKDDVYNEESSNIFIDKEEVHLYYQSSHNRYLENNFFEKIPNGITLLIGRGDIIPEHGILKKFYAEKECFVLVTVYYSEGPIVLEDEVEPDLTQFNKIHQFELYIKRDKDDPTTAAPDSRLHFEVSLKFGENNNMFEAYVCSKLGRKNPEFLHQDDFLAGNIYGVKERVRVSDLTLEDIGIDTQILGVCDNQSLDSH